MKKYAFVLITSIVMILSSCSSWQNVEIYGNRGTEIYDSELKLLGTIQDEGYAKIKLKRDGYTALLLSHEVGSDEYIPFAIDYKYVNNKTKEFLWAISPFTIVGLVPSLATMNGIAQDQFAFQFSYLEKQHTNENYTFTNTQQIGLSRVSAKTSSVSTTSKIKRDKPFSSKSTKSVKDFGKKISGEYIGSGKLYQGEHIIETYKSVLLVLERNGNKSVNVKILEDGIIPFFESEQEYAIQKTNNGYHLVLNGIPNAYIEINNENELKYYHSNIEIDGEIYTLIISAVK